MAGLSWAARVEDTHDDGSARLLRDEQGNLWLVAIDAADGTLAVEEVTDGERQEPTGRCGIWRWLAGSNGTIYPVEDGYFYGVNSTEDHVAHNGEWLPNEGG